MPAPPPPTDPPIAPRRVRAARRGVGRGAVRVLLLVALGLLGLAWRGPAASAANNAEEIDYLNRMNALRASVGVGPLQFDANMNALAADHTQVMVDQLNLFHTPDQTAGVTSDWGKLGENVGYGSNNAVVWDAFVHSDHHYQNLVDPAFTHVGISVMHVGNIQWTTHRFVQIRAPRPVFTPPPPPPSTMPPTTQPPVTAPPPTRPPVTTPPVTATTTTVTTAPPAPTTTVPPAPEPTPADPGRVDELLRVLRTS